MRFPLRALCCTLSASLLATCVLVSSASAEVPSVDAYGGQALVLGAPRHRQPPGKGPGALTRSNAHNEVKSSGEQARPSVRASGVTSGASASTSAGPATAADGGSHRTGAGDKARGEQSAGKQAGTSHANGAESANGAGLKTPLPASLSSPASPASGSSAFSASDLLLLFAMLLCLTALAVTLRMTRKPS